MINGLNQKLINTINTLDGSTLANKLTNNNKIDYQSSALIPIEAFKRAACYNKVQYHIFNLVTLLWD